MNCSPQELVKTARCFACVPKQQRWGAAAYLLCQWKNNQDVEPPTIPVVWVPATAEVTWTDILGLHVGNLALFTATADKATVGILDFPTLQNITSITGLQSLPLLNTLNISRELLTSLDVLDCDNLTTIDCSLNNLSSLNASGLLNLQTVECSGNPNMLSLNFSGCSSLISVVGNNLFALTSLTLTGCTSLVILSTAVSTNLTAINFADIPALVIFDGNSSGLLSANFSTCPLIVNIILKNSFNLSSIILTGCTVLQHLEAYGDALTSLDVSTCVSMNYLDINSCFLTDVEITTVICDIAAHAVNNGYLDVSFMVTPTAPGLVCSAALDPTRGWTVLHD